MIECQMLNGKMKNDGIFDVLCDVCFNYSSFFLQNESNAVNLLCTLIRFVEHKKNQRHGIVELFFSHWRKLQGQNNIYIYSFIIEYCFNSINNSFLLPLML